MILQECKTCGRFWYSAIEGQWLADDVCCVASLAAMRDPEEGDDDDDTPLMTHDNPDDFIDVENKKEQGNG